MIKKLLQEAFELKSKGYYKHAIEAFYKVLEVDNTSVELLLEIADVYNLMGEEERALNYIEQVLDSMPTHVGALKLLKKIFVGKNAWREAEQTAKNIYCITGDQDSLAEIFALLNKQGRFLEIFEYSYEQSNPKVMYEVANAKFLNGEFEEALALIDNVLAQEEENKIFLLKGQILLKLGRKEECVLLLDQMEFESKNPVFLNFVGLIHQYQGFFQSALEYFKSAIKLNPQSDEYYYNCASTYFKKGDIMQAKKYYNLAISLSPDNPNYHFALANLYYSEKLYKRAMEELRYDFFEAKLLKAIILYDSGYLALAKKELINLQKEDSENEIVASYLLKINDDLKI